MHEESMDKLQKLVKDRKQRSKIAGGEVFAIWGGLNLLAFFINQFLIDSVYVWLVMMVVGIIIQLVYGKYLKIGECKELFWTKNINKLWLFLIFLFPVLFYVFPFLLKLYHPAAIFPLIALWISLGMFLSGMLIEQKSMLAGSGVYILTAVLMAFFSDKILIIYPLSTVFGLIVPGIWSKYEEKSR
jgi:hypothetical protein